MDNSIDLDLLNEYEKMLDSDTNKRLERKAELIKLQDTLNRQITELDDMIAIYSTLDYIRVGELMGDRIRLNNALLDVMSEANDLYLESIKEAV
jgi:hypothetical protein